MKKYCILFVGLLSYSVGAFGQSNKPVGIQLSPVTAYSPEFVWKDVMKQSRVSVDPEKHGFMTFDLSQEDYVWDSGPVISDSLFVDSSGYPRYLPIDIDGVQTGVHTVLLVDIPRSTGEKAWGPHMWNLSADGTGVIRLKYHDNGCEPRQDIETPIYDSLVCINPEVEAGDDLALVIEIRESDINDPVRNIRLIMPDYDFWLDEFEPEEEEDFHPHFVTNTLGKTFWDDMDKVHVIKTTHWQRTVCSAIREWEDRSSADFYTQATKKGVAYEYIAKLANETGDTLWLNVPHQASDSFIYKMADFFLEELADSIHLYLEYSHEVWSPKWDSSLCGDSLLSQYHYAKIMGEGDTDYERRVDWQAKRSHEVFRIFGQVFGAEKHRINRVLSVNASDSNHMIDVVNRFLDIKDDTLDFDCLAIGPKVAQGHVAGDCDQIYQGSLLIDAMEDDLPVVFDQMNVANQIAQDYAKRMVLYEAWFGAPTPDCPPDSEMILDWENELRISSYFNAFCEFVTEWYLSYGSLMVYNGSITRFDSRASQEDHVFEQTEMLGLDRCQKGNSRPPWQVLFVADFCGLLSIKDIQLAYDPLDRLLEWNVSRSAGVYGTFEVQKATVEYDFETIDHLPETEDLHYDYSLELRDDISGLYRIAWNAPEESERTIFSNSIYIRDEGNEDLLILYPNPVSNRLYVKNMKGDLRDYERFVIYDALGRMISTQRVGSSNSASALTINTETFISGPHVIQAQKIDGATELYRFVKVD